MKQILSIFESLADENRLRIINLMLRSPELCVADIEKVLGMPQTRVSRHLGYLKSRGVVSSRRNGTWMYYSLTGTLTDTPQLQNALVNLFSQSEVFLGDIERLLEGLDENDIFALKDAEPSVLDDVITRCCEAA